MKITLNGEPYVADGQDTIEALLARLQVRGRVAVMINDEVIRRERYPEIVLREGDRVEIITMVGGG